MTPGCMDVCPGAMDMIQAYMKPENGEAMKKGDYSFMCDMIDTMKCMGTEKACQEPGKEPDTEGVSGIECMCACPDISKMEKMKPEDYCKADNPLTCLSSSA